MPGITFDAVAALLHLEMPGRISAEAWRQSQEIFPSGPLSFLHPDYVREMGCRLKSATKITDALVAALELFERHPLLQRWAWHCHYWLGCGGEETFQEVSSWLMVPETLGPGADLFYAIIFLSGIPNLLRMHQERKISEAVTWDTLSDLEIWIRDYRQKKGVWGFDRQGWLAHHFSGRLYRLGRLQYGHDSYPFDFHGFRHEQTRQVVMLAGDGMVFRNDGQFDGANGIHALEGQCWTAAFRCDEKRIFGHPIAATGIPIRRPIELDAARWRPVLGKGDPMLVIHIPAAGPMSHELCGQSFTQAIDFFPRHFPEYSFRGFCTSSWLLDRQFDWLLPGSSNIRLFLREYYLHPVPEASDQQTYERVFGNPAQDIRTAPQTSSLQKMMGQHAKSGGRFYCGGGVLFPEDFRWGQEVYQRKNGAVLELEN